MGFYITNDSSKYKKVHESVIVESPASLFSGVIFECYGDTEKDTEHRLLGVIASKILAKQGTMKEVFRQIDKLEHFPDIRGAVSSISISPMSEFIFKCLAERTDP